MGSQSSRPEVQPPIEINTFRKLGQIGNMALPELSERRRLTDRKMLFFFALCLCFLGPFLIYTLSYADMDRLTTGTDNCGNVCGKKNDYVAGIACSGQDFTDKPFSKLVTIQKGYEDLFLMVDTCVATCPNGEPVMNRCFPQEISTKDLDSIDYDQYFEQIHMDLKQSSGKIVLMCLVGLLLTGAALAMFRYQTALFVWSMLLVGVLALVLTTVAVWMVNSEQSKRSSSGSSNPLLGLCILLTMLSIGAIILLLCLMKRIKLVVQLLRESIRVVFQIPILLTEPMLTFMAMVVAVSSFVYVTALMLTAGHLTLQMTSEGGYIYEYDGMMWFTLAYNMIIIIWVCNFIAGCQHMVVAGAVASTYFKRSEMSSSAPIYTSFYNTIKFHLGSIAMGSLILTVVAIIKGLIRALISNRYLRLMVDWCLSSIEALLKYLSKNAYILIAIHGEPFYKSGKRATQLLASNALSAVAINSVGDFVMFMANVLIVLATIGFGTLIQDVDIKHFWAPITVAAVITFVMTQCAFGVFETAVDTIFLCYCEDKCVNDGSSDRPYYMSKHLELYMEEAKKIQARKESAR